MYQYKITYKSKHTEITFVKQTFGREHKEEINQSISIWETKQTKSLIIVNIFYKLYMKRLKKKRNGKILFQM